MDMPPMPPPPSQPPRSGGGHLLIDLMRFQVKLLVDAARDLVLVPLAFAAAGLDLLLSRHQPPRYFYRLLQLGERSERLIDLWSVIYERLGPAPSRIDSVIDGVEAAVRDPALGRRRAKVLRRWLERQWHRQQRSLRVPGAPPPVDARPPVDKPEKPVGE